MTDTAHDGPEGPQPAGGDPVLPEDAVTSPQPAVPPAEAEPQVSEEPTADAPQAEASEAEAPEAVEAEAELAAVADEPDTPVAPLTRADVLDPAAAPGPAPAPAPAPVGIQASILYGQTLGNRYRLDDRIATGGMGEVWAGTDELLGRPVAVKLLRAVHMDDEQFRIRFRGEARYAASLSHPGIARVYDYGESGEDPAAFSGVPYLVMELVEGEPLSAALARDGHLSADATLDLVAQAARALGAAHAAGIVHRDIKPGNLLITPDGKIKITDFGIARAALAGAHLTQTGMVMGTAQYVSPEQASALPVSSATDIYSLGVVAYECLAGQPPFTAETPIALALAHVSTPPPALPDSVPAPVTGLVMQMLAKQPGSRPASAELVAERASALRGSTPGGDDPWIIGSPALADPSTWFADPSATAAPEPAHSGTAPMAAARAVPVPDRASWLRRPAALVLVLALVVVGLATGTIVVLASGNHPGAAASTGHGRRAHQTTVVQPSSAASSQSAYTGGQSLVPSSKASSTSSRRPSSPPVKPSVSPTTSISPTSVPTSATPPIQTSTPPTSPPPTSPSPTGGPTAGAGQLVHTITQDG